MDSRTIDLARESFDRCSKVDGFLERFYEKFFEDLPEARPLFAETDFERQQKLLRHAIGLLLIFPMQKGDASLLDRVAQRHDAEHLNIRPEMYGPFVESLLATVEEVDHAATPEVMDAWRVAIAPGVDYMKSRYRLNS